MWYAFVKCTFLLCTISRKRQVWRAHHFRLGKIKSMRCANSFQFFCLFLNAPRLFSLSLNAHPAAQVLHAWYSPSPTYSFNPSYPSSPTCRSLSTILIFFTCCNCIILDSHEHRALTRLLPSRLNVTRRLFLRLLVLFIHFCCSPEFP